jgi:hypothetical protein
MASITKLAKEQQEGIIDPTQKLFKGNGFDKTQVARFPVLRFRIHLYSFG